MLKKLIPILLILSLCISSASAATLTVGSTAKYHKIQDAVNAAKTGDTIYVNAGTYKELVKVTGKNVIFQGQKTGSTYKYPTVYGFKFLSSSKGASGGNVNGFKINKYGVDYGYGMGGNCIIRNNYFENCGVNLSGFSCSYNTIMNNKFSGNYNYIGVNMYESQENIITGNTFSKAKIGINCGYCSTYSDSKNTFVYCKTTCL